MDNQWRKKNYLIPKYPILIGNNINEDYYVDIYKYLYVDKYNLNTERYQKYIYNIKDKKKENKKKIFRKKFRKFYLNDKNKLCKKIFVQNKENSNSISSNIYIEVKNDIYKLLFIPETLMKKKNI